MNTMGARMQVLNLGIQYTLEGSKPKITHVQLEGLEDEHDASRLTTCYLRRQQGDNS